MEIFWCGHYLAIIKICSNVQEILKVASIFKEAALWKKQFKTKKSKTYSFITT